MAPRSGFRRWCLVSAALTVCWLPGHAAAAALVNWQGAAKPLFQQFRQTCEQHHYHGALCSAYSRLSPRLRQRLGNAHGRLQIKATSRDTARLKLELQASGKLTASLAATLHHIDTKRLATFIDQARPVWLVHMPQRWYDFLYQSTLTAMHASLKTPVTVRPGSVLQLLPLESSPLSEQEAELSPLEGTLHLGSHITDTRWQIDTRLTMPKQASIDATLKAYINPPISMAPIATSMGLLKLPSTRQDAWHNQVYPQQLQLTVTNHKLVENIAASLLPATAPGSPELKRNMLGKWLQQYLQQQQPRPLSPRHLRKLSDFIARPDQLTLKAEFQQGSLKNTRLWHHLLQWLVQNVAKQQQYQKLQRTHYSAVQEDYNEAKRRNKYHQLWLETLLQQNISIRYE